MSFVMSKCGLISHKIRSNAKNNNFLILMYHRVLPLAEVDWKIQPGMYVSDDSLRMHVRFLKRYFSLVPLSHFITGNTSCQNIEKPLCAITFDDGWRDFYDYAYPVLKAHDVPATVFLATDFIGSYDMFWTDRVTLLLEQSEHLDKIHFEDDMELNKVICSIKGLSGSKGQKLEKAIEILKALPLRRIEKLLDSALPDGNFRKNSRVFLAWDGIHEMQKGGLISFGSHTCSHQILTTLDENDITAELENSKEVLLRKNVCHHDFIPFCYPNGNYTDHIAELVKQAGYSMAVTTNNGWNNNMGNLYKLKRVGIHNDMTFTESMFAAQIVSLFG